MRVAIAGAGGIAYSYAAFLSSRGHEPILWSPSGQRARALANGQTLTATGALEGSWPVAVADNPSDLLAECDVIIIAVPAYGYRPVLQALLPHLRRRQTVLFSAHLSFAALWLSKELSRIGKSCSLGVWNTTASTGRQQADDTVSISLLRRQVGMAVIPADQGEAVLSLCETLFGDRFVLTDDLLSVELSNLNPIVHYGIVLFNLTRMEKAETWAQQEYMTPAVCRFLEALDAERLSIARALGLKTRTIQESYATPGEVAPGPLARIMEKVVLLRRPVNGPKSMETRYVTEDVPYGLATTLKLASLCGIEAPLHLAGIQIFSSLYGRDFAAENPILPDLSEAFESTDRMRNVSRMGWDAGLADKEVAAQVRSSCTVPASCGSDRG